jgi:glycosyltransferase involved in cell wall biosynthesis
MSTSKNTILFFAPKLGGGGAEMQIVRLLQYTDYTKYDIILALTRPNGSYEKMLPTSVKIIYLNKKSASSFWALVFSSLSINKIIKKHNPGFIISLMETQNIFICLTKFFYYRSWPKIICLSQNSPIQNYSNQGILGKILLKLIPFAYKNAFKIIALSKGVADELQFQLKIKTPIFIVHNSGYGINIHEQLNNNLPINVKPKENQILACGRLIHQKGFDILLKSIKIVSKKIPINLWIIGEGKDLNFLTDLSIKLNIQDKVKFLGFHDNPFPFYKCSKLFIMSSRWEGFGNVIVESMVSGTPVISTNCNFGPNEIIKDGESGLLCDVENPHDLASKIILLLEDKDLYEKIKINGFLKAKTFAPDVIAQQFYSNLI